MTKPVSTCGGAGAFVRSQNGLKTAARLAAVVCLAIATTMPAWARLVEPSKKAEQTTDTAVEEAIATDTEPATPGGGIGAVIELHGEITDIMATSIKRRLDEAVAQGATTIVFEMDTPGGLVTSSIAIADMIKNLRHQTGDDDIKTIAWVNTNAHSGGSIVAIACDEIVMAPSSRMGDAQVIMLTPGGAQAVSDDLKAKANTPVITEVRTSARINGYDELLCESFVIPEIEVWWIEHKESGEREFVTTETKLKRLGGTGRKSIFDTGDAEEESGTAEADWQLVEDFVDILSGKRVPTSQPVVRDDMLLQMSPSEAHAYGFCKRVVTSTDDLKLQYGLASTINLLPTWSEDLAYWLTSMWVRAFLLIVIFLGAYVEFHTPGVGVPGLTAVIALAVFVGAPYLTGLANIWEILMIAIGVILIALEVFVIPGFGVPGIAGLLFVLVGLIATFAPDEPGKTFPLFVPTLDQTVIGLKSGVIMVISSMTLSLVGAVMLSRYLPSIPYLKQLIPANPTPSEVVPEDPYRGAARVGDIGSSVGPLRPAGKGKFGGQIVDVVTEGEYVDEGAQLEVIERRGNRVVVRVVT